MSIEELQKKYNFKIDYLDKLIRIQVGEAEDNTFYQELVACIKKCDDKVVIANDIIGKSTKEEFLQGEEIIQKVVESINPNWNKKQKIAYVHYKIGKLISYIPDANYKVIYANSKDAKDARNIWKSLLNGKSVCNGIVSIERNILSRVGVTTKALNSASGNHTYMMAEVEDGNMLDDPTWDLKNTLYGARPLYFGKTYEQFQQIDGMFSEAHKLENIPEGVIEISDEELREIYHSLGFTKEDRTFIYPIFDKFNKVNNQNDNMEDRLNALFTMFTKQFPIETTHLTETRSILEQCIYEIGINPSNLKTKFVYMKDDIDCENPYLSLFINDEQLKKQMYLLNLDQMRFESINIPEFDKNYKTHKLDNVEPFWKNYLTITQSKKNEDIMEI